MLRGTCLSCYRLYARASTALTAPTSPLPDVSSSCDGKRCVARSSSAVKVPRSACNGGCRRPPARRVVATAAVAASAVAAAELDRRRKEGGALLSRVSFSRGSVTNLEARGGPRTGGGLSAPPPMFGRAVPIVGTTGTLAGSVNQRMTHTDAGSGDLGALKPSAEDREDCPICRKFSRGPCGDFFAQWLKCTDDHPGKDAATGEELHLSECEKFALPLARCLEENDDYYNSPLNEDRDDVHTSQGEGRDGRELRRAWSGLVDDLEHPREKRRKLSFPRSIRPEMQVRPSTNEGMAAFAPKNERGEELILAYVRDKDTGELLGAGSSEDVRSGGGIIRFGVKDGTKNVTACALYGGTDESPIYKRTEAVPPKEQEGETKAK